MQIQSNVMTLHKSMNPSNVSQSDFALHTSYTLGYDTTTLHICKLLCSFHNEGKYKLIR